MTQEADPVPTGHAGGCVCGAIRFRTEGEPLRVTICHCRWCQKRTGTEVVYRDDQISFLGDPLKTYRHISDESGRWLDVVFCGKCGSNLGFTLEAAPGIRTLPAGSFDDPDWIRADRFAFLHVYIRSRQDWSDLSSDVEVYEQHFRA